MDRNTKILWGIISFGLALLTIAVVLRQSGSLSVSELIKIAHHSNKLMLGIAMICSLLYIVFEGVAILSILKSAGYKRIFFDGLLYSSADIYFSSITPSATGGQPASAFFMLGDGIPGGVVTAALILNLTMYTASIIVLGIIAILIKPSAFLGFKRVSKCFIIIGFVVFTILSLLFLLILKKGEWLFDLFANIIDALHKKKIIRSVDKKHARIQKARADYDKCASILSGKKRILFKAFIWNFLQRLSQIIVPMFVYIGLFGNADNAAMVFSKQCMITIGFNFVPIPGAMGIADYLMIDGFSNIMRKSDAFKLELISRSMTFYICILMGALITLIGYIIKRRKKC